MAKALVVYATITGNNEDVADIITDALEDLGVEVDEVEMTMADPADFEEAELFQKKELTFMKTCKKNN